MGRRGWRGLPAMLRAGAWAVITPLVVLLVVLAGLSSPAAGVPVRAPMPAPPVALAASGLGWGADQFGQLGPGPNATALTPVSVPLPINTTALALGRDFTLAVADGRVYSWGRNDRGQLGDGTQTSRMSPAPVSVPVIPFVQVAADEEHALALSATGLVYAWGGNTSGELGDGTTTDRATPVLVAPLVGVSAIGTGRDHSLAVVAGKIFAWGSDSHGQLGLGSPHGSPYLSPEPVHLPPGVLVTEVAAGYRHSVALATDHRVVTWGDNDRAQLGRSAASAAEAATPTAYALPSGAAAAAVQAGAATSAARTSDGAIFAWGANDHGQLGDGSTTDRAAPVGVHLPVGFAASAFSVSQSATVALSGSGQSLLTWGAGADGQVGNGARADALTPVAVPLPSTPVPATTPRVFTAVAAGYYFDIAVTQLGAPARLLLAPASAVRAVGSGQAYTVEAYDASGTDLGPRPGATLMMTGGSCSGLTCTPSTPGDQTVTASSDGVTGTATLHVVAAAPGPTPTASGTPTGGQPTTSSNPPTSAPGVGSGANRPGGSGGMAFTGAVGITLLVVLGVAALGGGLALTTAARRRRATREKP